jgi:hypothetical protein
VSISLFQIYDNHHENQDDFSISSQVICGILDKPFNFSGPHLHLITVSDIPKLLKTSSKTTVAKDRAQFYSMPFAT